MSELIHVGQGREGKVFYDKDLPKALEQARKYAGEEGRVATLQDIAQARIIATRGEGVWSRVWSWFTLATGEYKGHSKQGNCVYVVTQGVGPLETSPGRIRQAYEEGLVRGAARLTQKELYALLDQEGNNVTVLDFDKIKKLTSGRKSVDEARNSPIDRARLGKHADAYFDKHREFFGDDFYSFHDCGGLDLNIPQGRLLFLGYNDYDDYILGYLAGDGCFVALSGYVKAPQAPRMTPQEIKVRNPLSLEEKGLESKILEALQKGIGFSYKGLIYAPVKKDAIEQTE